MPAEFTPLRFIFVCFWPTQSGGYQLELSWIVLDVGIVVTGHLLQQLEQDIFNTRNV